MGVKPIRACLKQFMMCLEATWFVAAFHSTPMHDPGPESSDVQFGSACARVPVYNPASPVAVVGVEDRPPFSDLGCALRRLNIVTCM